MIIVWFSIEHLLYIKGREVHLGDARCLLRMFTASEKCPWLSRVFTHPLRDRFITLFWGRFFWWEIGRVLLLMSFFHFLIVPQTQLKNKATSGTSLLCGVVTYSAEAESPAAEGLQYLQLHVPSTIYLFILWWAKQPQSNKYVILMSSAELFDFVSAEGLVK